MLDKMIALAAKAHEGQFDKGGQPYILHPLAVMEMLPDWAYEQDEIRQIAVGHDLLEDTSVTYYDLRSAGFSSRVCDAIWLLTKTSAMCPTRYQQNVLSSVDTMIVKFCDLRHNSDLSRLKGHKQKDFDRLIKYAKFSALIKERLNEVLQGL